MRIMHSILAVSVFAAAGLGASAARAQQKPAAKVQQTAKAGPSVIVYKSPT
jgi:hypothetical protein